MGQNDQREQNEKRKRLNAKSIGDTIVDEDLPAELRNRDPVTGEPGCHAVGSGIGAALGAVGVGAAAGTVAGPIGTVVGAVVGGVIGGLAGKEIGEAVNPTVEAAYWEEHYTSRPYYVHGKAFEYYRPAYQIGWKSFDEQRDQSWEEREPELKKKWVDVSRWENEGGAPTMTWEEAKLAAKDAHDRLADMKSKGTKTEPRQKSPR